MKRLILLVILICNLSASHKINNEFTDIEKEYILTNTLKIGMIIDYYPFSFEENGKAKGFSFDYLDLIVKKDGLKIEIEMDNWTNTLEKFKNSQIDLIDVISYSKSREEYTNFSKAYYEIPTVLFTSENQFDTYTDFTSLEGKKVGYTKNIYYYDKINNLKLFELVEFENSQDKIKALAHGKIDAAFNNIISGQKYIKKWLILTLK